MNNCKINAVTLSGMFLSGAANLNANRDYINELNVFPVPDGDTGTNMSLTIMSAVNEIKALEKTDMKSLCKAVSSGSLRGARGNSGVILSQLLRGFCKVIKEVDEVDPAVFANACIKAVETAYKAVMRPKEGTILTVAKGISDKAAELADNAVDFNEFFNEVLTYGEKVLSETPEMLPVLKEAGVVDSGGQGLIEFLKGGLAAYNGQSVDIPDIAPVKTTAESAAAVKGPAKLSTDDIKFGYCTEFIIMTDKPFSDEDEDNFKAFLETMGDSIVCVADDDIVKIHVHTNDPGVVISAALKHGELSRLKIDNMREEHRELLNLEGAAAVEDRSAAASPDNSKTDKPEFDKEFGFLSVSIGEGFSELFAALGCDFIIEGGQTMNPSTDDILNAINKVDARNIFVLPNNKNIILAANQAKMLTEDKNIIVIPTTTIPQGVAAMLGFIPEESPEYNEQAITEAISAVRTGEVTYAVRNTKIDGRKIKKGDYMGIGDEGILANGPDMMEVTLDMVRCISEDAANITVYYGIEADESQVEILEKELAKAYPDAEVSVLPGGQPVYYYIISVE